MGEISSTLTVSSALDNLHLTLHGPDAEGNGIQQAYSIATDGSGWFGAVNLLPGDYVLATEKLASGVSLTMPVTIEAGAVAQQTLVPPEGSFNPRRWTIYLPLTMKVQSTQKP